MKVLLTGAGGQLGGEFARVQWPEGIEVSAVRRAALDICDYSQVESTISRLGPGVIINCAAYTAVDEAETHPELAAAVNDQAVAELCQVASRSGAKVVHFSSDYVFDGKAGRPYREDDPVSPLGVYAKTKAAGERHVLASKGGIVLRTSWVYGAVGPNFVATMLRLGKETEQIGVVDDQFGCPTAAVDIAKAVSSLLPALACSDAPSGLFHLAAPDSASWFELAEATFTASSFGFDGELRRLSTGGYPTLAPRPADTRLECARIESEFGIKLPSWRLSLPEVVAEMEAL